MSSELHGKKALQKAQTLKAISTDAKRWETTLIDEATGETWRLDYPNGDLHGGGPPRLTRIGPR